LKVGRQLLGSIVDWNAPLTEFPKEIRLGQAGHLRRLPQCGFLRHE
jgi:hypothetical protein